MLEAYEKKVGALSLEKALAIAAYGESVAAYRYCTLAERTTSAAQRQVFMEMAKEEQGHHMRLQELTRKEFSGSDFVLRAEDKELVVVGPRLLEVSDSTGVQKAMELVYETERLTGRFYAALHGVTHRAELRPFLKEMADECFEHAERLRSIPQVD